MATQYRDYYSDLINLMDYRAENLLNYTAKTLICKVVETDGFYVDVFELNYKNAQNDGDLAIKGIPILQGKGFSVPIKKDDIGILLNIQVDLGNILEDKENTEFLDQNFYVFLPIVSKANFKSNANDLYITSNENKSTMILNDEKISLETEGNYTDTIKGNYKVEAQGDLSIKGGSNAVEFGNSTGTLKTAFDAIFQAMDLIASGMTGTSTNPSAYNGGKSALQQQISQIFK